jgi:hypothetical protein
MAKNRCGSFGTTRPWRLQELAKELELALEGEGKHKQATRVYEQPTATVWHGSNLTF